MIEQVQLARVIAYAAHGAKGQKRADNETPYISHPRRVVELTEIFLEDAFYAKQKYDVNPNICRAAAWLHDVLEDTKLTRDDLIKMDVGYPTLDIVELLTKKNGNEPATPEYYQGIASNLHALIVKCADRCSNLEDALLEVQKTRGLKRWKRYVEKTYTDVLPMYVTLPLLRSAIIERLDAIENALNQTEEQSVQSHAG